MPQGVQFYARHQLGRDRDRERAQARGTAKGKGKDDGLTPEQRRESDGKALQEKAAKKAAEGAGSGHSEVSVEIYESKSKILQILFLLLMTWIAIDLTSLIVLETRKKLRGGKLRRIRPYSFTVTVKSQIRLNENEYGQLRRKGEANEMGREEERMVK
ncbi:hypothetical protein TEA_009440 [Camellia sinensis var. sinensis]|uniref:Small EDRK-rich factor-like N-terminal domain-containing protein n=1 Tax=Camellia sinensis var. sinensis TaxID=542762 RepID=A0A4S4ESX3_CAMSN|nr:hypothetical protein TEA_009440 [Camellia sinensis var. sinensis]